MSPPLQPFCVTRTLSSGETILLTTSRDLLDIHKIHKWLSTDSYWARDMPLSLVRTSIENSLPLGLYVHSNTGDGNRQIGFARWVTDYASFAWLTDVYVEREFRGMGLGRWMSQQLLEIPETKVLRRMMLITGDATELYENVGWESMGGQSKEGYGSMEIKRDVTEIYQRMSREELEQEAVGAEAVNGTKTNGNM